MSGDADASDDAVAWTFIYCSVASVASCSLVLAFNAYARTLSRFPESLLFLRLASDAVLSVCLLVQNAGQLITGKTMCSTPLVFITQFSIFGSLGWYACLALNLYLSVSRPFVRASERMNRYHAFVWLGATVTASLASTHAGYRPLYHLCWSRALPRGQLNFYNWVLVFG